MSLTTATTNTSNAVDLAKIAAIDFAPVDPTMTVPPTAEDWAIVSYKLHTALLMAAAVLAKPKTEPKETLAGGDADGLPERLAAILKAAGEGFGKTQAACAAAEARVYIAAAVVA